MAMAVFIFTDGCLHPSEACLLHSVLNGHWQLVYMLKTVPHVPLNKTGMSALTGVL